MDKDVKCSELQDMGNYFSLHSSSAMSIQIKQIESYQ